MRRKPDLAAMRRLNSAFPGDHRAVFIFTTEPVDPDVIAYSRMFAPGLASLKIPRPAVPVVRSGSYLVKHGLVHRDQMRDMVSLQGVAMGRPSRIHMRIAEDGTARSRACR